MSDFLKRLNLSAIATALCAGALVLGASAGAQARDDHWDRKHDRHYDRHGHYDHGRYYRHERPVIVERRPVVVDRRPVIVDRRPVIMAPAYQPAPSGLNLNFTIPLQ